MPKHRSKVIEIMRKSWDGYPPGRLQIPWQDRDVESSMSQHCLVLMDIAFAAGLREVWAILASDPRARILGDPEGEWQDRTEDPSDYEPNRSLEGYANGTIFEVAAGEVEPPQIVLAAAYLAGEVTDADMLFAARVSVRYLALCREASMAAEAADDRPVFTVAWTDEYGLRREDKRYRSLNEAAERALSELYKSEVGMQNPAIEDADPLGDDDIPLRITWDADVRIDGKSYTGDDLLRIKEDDYPAQRIAALEFMRQEHTYGVTATQAPWMLVMPTDQMTTEQIEAFEASQRAQGLPDVRTFMVADNPNAMDAKLFLQDHVEERWAWLNWKCRYGYMVRAAKIVGAYHAGEWPYR